MIHLGLRLRSLRSVQRASICDSLTFDPLAFDEDGLAAPEVDVGRGKIVEALVTAGMVVVLEESVDLGLKI